MNQPNNINDARRMAIRWERAHEMTEAGYIAHEDEAVKDLHIVTSPEGNVYLVMLFGSHQTCTCPDFVKHEDFCKHVFWVTEELHNAELVAEYEARYGACEMETTGTDPYAEY